LKSHNSAIRREGGGERSGTERDRMGKTTGTKDHSKQADCVTICQISKRCAKLQKIPCQRRHIRVLCSYLDIKYLKTSRKCIYKWCISYMKKE
jgi:thymidylate synthase